MQSIACDCLALTFAGGSDVADMKDFLVVLMVILVMYMYVFQMLLNAPSGPSVNDPLPGSGANQMGFPLAPMTLDHAPYNSSEPVRSGLSFEEGVMSFITVHNMMYLLRPLYMEYLYVEFVCKCIYVYFTYILYGAGTSRNLQRAKRQR